MFPGLIAAPANALAPEPIRAETAGGGGHMGVYAAGLASAAAVFALGVAFVRRRGRNRRD